MAEQDLRIAIAQINCTVGDLAGNSEKIISYAQEADNLGAEMVCFPELAVTGYPPEDLLLKPKFIADNLGKIKRVTGCIGRILAIVGFVDKDRAHIYNSAAVCYDGRIRGVYRKMHLPNYGVFDEERYFEPGSNPWVFRYGSLIFGVNICEDIWHSQGPARSQVASGARLILNINASPYHAGKAHEREEVLRKRARDNQAAIVYTNLVGGQDELVFDGQSMIVDKDGRIVKRAEAFKEQLLIADLKLPARRTRPGSRVITVSEKQILKNKSVLPPKSARPLQLAAEVYQALVLGLKDYVAKNGFEKVIIGLSGGIDSSIVAALAVDALGKDNVAGVYMPSRYSSAESEVDARQLAGNLGIRLIMVPIEQIYKLYLMTLEPHFFGLNRDVTEENLQARIRGSLLMALSNKFGWLVLTTGNKSEMSTGYATLYGDMAGGFAVIKDVPKTLVYKLARYRNSQSQVIPQRVLTKEPSAELKPNQKDSDTLPPYKTLDPILKDYIEEDKSAGEIVSAGFGREMVNKILSMVDRNEYKRRQAPPGIKITPKAFGRDRRMPITNKYRG